MNASSSVKLRRQCWILLLLLSGCGGGNSPPSQPYPGRLDPIVGQWADYGTGTGAGFVQRLSNPFWMPLKTSNQSVNYVYTGVNNILTGTMTLNFSVTGYAQFGVADPADSPPATLRLFIWAANDNGGEFGRWWCNPALELVPGDNQVWECPLIPSAWTDVYGHTNANQFNAVLVNPYAVGFTFGGQSFAGHGVWVTVGAARFKINSFTVQ